MFRNLMQKLFGKGEARAWAVEAEPDSIDFLRRVPVLDRNQHIAGYEFSLERPDAPARRQWQASSQRFFDESLLDHLDGAELSSLIGRRLAFVSLMPDSLDLPRLARLPAERMVLSLIDPGAQAMPAVDALGEAIRALRPRGYRFALPQSMARGESGGLLALADFIAIDADRLSPPDLLTVAQQCQRDFRQARTLACGVDSLELFEVCRRLGFDYLRGNYITQRREDDTPSLSSQRLVVIQLISQLKRKEADFDKLAMIARQALALSVRLLRYIKSIQPPWACNRRSARWSRR